MLLEEFRAHQDDNDPNKQQTRTGNLPDKIGPLRPREQKMQRGQTEYRSTEVDGWKNARLGRIRHRCDAV
jgi:hypothetical protein